MEMGKKRVGRPKSEPRTGPLVLDELKSRQKTEIELTIATASEFAEYAAWVETSSSLNTADARSTTVEFALRDLFRKDRIWRERQATPVPSASATPAANASHEVLLSPSLPPSPSGAARSPR
jgi:hypothetical protein